MSEEFDPMALDPKALEMYRWLFARLSKNESPVFLSLLKLAFYQGALAGAERMHEAAKKIVS